MYDLYKESARLRTGLDSHQKAWYIQQKMLEGRGLLLYLLRTNWLDSVIESWQDKKFVANSGLIVNPKFRGTGLAKTLRRRR